MEKDHVARYLPCKRDAKILLWRWRDAIFMHLNASAPEMSESKTMQNIATSVVERFLCRALRIHTYVIGNTTLCMYRLLIKGWNSICFISVIPTALSKLECTVLSSSQWNITKESGLSSFSSLFSTGLLLFLPFMDASVASIQLPEEKQCYYLTQVAFRTRAALLSFGFSPAFVRGP